MFVCLHIVKYSFIIYILNFSIYIKYIHYLYIYIHIVYTYIYIQYIYIHIYVCAWMTLFCVDTWCHTPKKMCTNSPNVIMCSLKIPNQKMLVVLLGTTWAKFLAILLLVEQIVFTTEDGHKPNWVTLIRKIEICMNQRLDGYGWWLILKSDHIYCPLCLRWWLKPINIHKHTYIYACAGSHSCSSGKPSFGLIAFSPNESLKAANFGRLFRGSKRKSFQRHENDQSRFRSNNCDTIR